MGKWNKPDILVVPLQHNSGSGGGQCGKRQLGKRSSPTTPLLLVVFPRAEGDLG